VARALSVNVRLGNPAAEQVYRGLMRKLDCTAGTLILRDRHASVQITEQNIAAAWIVTIPTKAGRIESIELHAADGEVILAICGVRTNVGRQELSWHEFLSEVPHTRIEPDPILCTSIRPEAFGQCQLDRQARMGF
jgi:putative heme degradation protein